MKRMTRKCVHIKALLSRRSPTLCSVLSMNIHWVPPPHGMVKVNCHGVTLQEIAANGNTSGLGVNFRRTNGNMISCVAGSMRTLSPLGNQLWAVFSGMRRAFLGDSRRVIIETDNLEAFGAIKFPNANATVEISSIVQQILLLKNNPTWNCSIRFVYSRRNKVATYLALLGAEIFTRPFLFFEPLGRAAELIDLDIGLGPHDPDLLEAEMAEEELEQLEVLMADVEGNGGGVGCGLPHSCRFPVGPHGAWCSRARNPGCGV